MFNTGADSHLNSSEFIQPSGLGYEKRDRSCSASVPADPMAVHEREVASTWLPVTVCALQCKRTLSRRKRCSVNEQGHDTTAAVQFFSFCSFFAVFSQFFCSFLVLSQFFSQFFCNICTAVFLWFQKLQCSFALLEPKTARQLRCNFVLSRTHTKQSLCSDGSS